MLEQILQTYDGISILGDSQTLTGVKSHLSSSRKESLQMNKGCATATHVPEHKCSQCLKAASQELSNVSNPRLANY